MPKEADRLEEIKQKVEEDWYDHQWVWTINEDVSWLIRQLEWHQARLADLEQQIEEDREQDHYNNCVTYDCPWCKKLMGEDDEEEGPIAAED